jgi:hypothetical protein
VPGGGEPGHVDADLGDDDRGGDAADAGDLIQPVRCGGERDEISSILASSPAMLASIPSARASILPSRSAWPDREASLEQDRAAQRHGLDQYRHQP